MEKARCQLFQLLRRIELPQTNYNIPIYEASRIDPGLSTNGKYLYLGMIGKLRAVTFTLI